MAYIQERQPLSLITIKTNHGTKLKKGGSDSSDLLTIRVLETSEKKMQLLKRLLSPDDYTSLEAQLYSRPGSFAKPDGEVDFQKFDKLYSSNNRQKLSSVPLEMSKSKISNNNEVRQLSRSAVNIVYSAAKISENIVKKREAIDFFFQDSRTSSAVQNQELEIELRSGYYLTAQIESQTKSFMQEPSFSLSDRLNSLLNLFGFSIRTGTHQNRDEEFINHFRTCGHLPYCSERNLLLMRSRLEADNHTGTKSIITPTRTSSNDTSTCEKYSQSFVTRRSIERDCSSIGSKTRVTSQRALKYEDPRDELGLMKNQARDAILNRFIKGYQLSSMDSNELVKLGLLDYIRIRSITIRLRSHELLSSEETMSVNLDDLWHQYELLRDDLSIKSTALLTAIGRKIDGAQDIDYTNSELASLLSLHLDSLVKFKTLKQDIISLMKEIESTRREQKFNSTSCLIQTNDESADVISIRFQVKALVDSIKDSDTTKEFAELASQYITSEEGLLDINALTRREIKITPSRECPLEEIGRRQNIVQLLRSLEFIMIFDGSVRCNLKSPHDFIHHLSVDLLETNQEIFIPYRERPRSFDLKLEVYARRIRFLPYFMTNLITVDSCIKLSQSDMISSARLKFKVGDDQTELELLLSATYFHKASRIIHHSKISIHEKRVDDIYGRVFNKCHLFDDTASRLHKLVNKIDPRLLNEFISGCEMKKYFCLITEMNFDDKNSKKLACETAPMGFWTLRQALLAWRWLNHLNQVVHLSRAENLKKFGLQQLDVERLKPELKALVMDRPETGYRLIEQIRLKAIDHIREFEKKLNQILEFNARKDKDRTLRPTNLLREPHLSIDLSGIVRLARILVPKPTAHRPLMPDRKTIERRSNLLNQEIQFTRSNLDLENLDNRMLNAQRVGNLQLVVTVQQASNLPLRVINQVNNHIQPPTRSNSPFYPSSPLGVRAEMTPVSSRFLVPPTTYIECIFQRNHQTTSLAEGKDPTWNETMFFPVRVGHASQTRDGTSFWPLGQDQGMQNQLVGEFLELNMYDYNIFMENESSEDVLIGDQSTMMIGSSNQDTGLAISSEDYLNVDKSQIRAKKLLASRQRIERHLLGSLRVPLTTLLTNGRIEGSFNLNQSLFLDDYQFERLPEPLLPTSRNLRSPSPLSETNNLSDHRHQETSLSLFITLDPPVSIPSIIHLPVSSFENQQVFEYARLWEKVVSRHYLSMQKLHDQQSNGGQTTGLRSGASWRRLKRAARSFQHNRHIRALVLRSDARYYLICRLLCPISPPESLLDGAKDPMRVLARFVSILNPFKHGLFNLRLLDSTLWFSSQQLIEENLGGPEEKAVLLCNYFLHLGYCSALILGNAIPEGPCVYVIVWQDRSSGFVRDQMRLQASTLLESINNLGIASPDELQIGSSSLQAISKIPVDSSNFFTRLPILMSGKFVQLWNPISGNSYSLNQKLPLVSVGSIVTLDNVYANIQVTDNLVDTNFDIRLKNHWFPLFDSNFPASSLSRSFNPLVRNLKSHSNWRRQMAQLDNLRRSIERPQMKSILDSSAGIQYKQFTPDECQELTHAIEKVIKANLLKWRPDRPTYFNRTLSRQLAEKLSTLENYLIGNVEGQAASSWRVELANIIRNEVVLAHIGVGGQQSRKIISWPANMPFTSMKTILDSLYASGVHNADMTIEVNAKQSAAFNTQFIVACHVHPYPARAQSVWLYVAAVVPNTRFNMSRTLNVPT